MNDEKKNELQWAIVKLNYALEFIGQTMEWLPTKHSLVNECDTIQDQLLNIRMQLRKELNALTMEGTNDTRTIPMP